MARFEGGWVKMHRKVLDSDIGKNFLLLGLWITLIRWANWSESKINWRGTPRSLKRGELLTSATELADFGEVDPKTVTKWLNYLELRKSIVIEKSPRGSKQGMIIKVLNYEKYQSVDASWSAEGGDEHGDEPPMTMDTSMATYKESKKLRNKELKKANPIFEKAFALYPIQHKGPNAEGRFAEQIKNPEDLTDLMRALENYKANLAKNPWRHPKGNFSTFLGTERSGFFWRDWIDSDAIQAHAGEQSEYEKWAAAKAVELEGKAG